MAAVESLARIGEKPHAQNNVGFRSGSRPNRAFESGRADKQRAFGLQRWRRAAQRDR